MQEIPSNITNYLSVFQTLIGGLLTFLGGLIGNYFIQRSQRNAELNNLASAFYGEISSILAIVKRRNYVESMTYVLENVEADEAPEFTYYRGQNEKFRIYESNVSKIGLLPAPIPEKLISFYTLAEVIHDDLGNLNSFLSDKPAIDNIKDYLKDLISLIENLSETGKELQDLLQRNANLSQTTRQ